MRSDALRNRSAVLDAAAELLAAGGLRVPVEDIARAAGVGVGTVHRHFSTKDLLVDAVLVDWCRDLLDDLHVAITADDPVAGLEGFLERVVAFHSERRALAEALRHAERQHAELAAARIRLGEGLTELVERAQSLGRLRDDVGLADLRLLFAALAQTTAVGGEELATVDKLRFVRILLDGLVTPAPSRLPESSG